MSTHLVTGGAGFIGSHLVSGLLDAGHSVRVIDNLDSGSRENLHGMDVDLMVADIRDAGACLRAAEGCEVVYHLAAIASVPRSVADPAESFSVNGLGTSQVFEAARRSGVRRVVCASSAAVYGSCTLHRIPETTPLHPESPYGAEKAAMEQLAIAYSTSLGLEIVPMRFFNVYGPRQDPNSSYSGVIAAFLGALVRERAPEVHGDGSQSRDFVHVSDVVAACRLAAEKAQPGLPYNVGTGHPTSVLDLLRHLQEALGAPPDVHWTDRRSGDVDVSCANVERLTSLGYAPAKALHTSLAETAKWYRSHLLRT